jgi:hypothetical protein
MKLSTKALCELVKIEEGMRAVGFGESVEGFELFESREGWNGC